MKNVYITALGSYLPNKPIENNEIENFLGKIKGKKSVAKERILKQNGIKKRYYAIDKNQQSTHSNAQMAAQAIRNAADKTSLNLNTVELLSTGTSQADLPLPGFASMVHAELGNQKCELSSFQSICASGMMALKNAYLQIKSGEKNNAVSVGSEFASRMFKASRYEAQGVTSLPFDAEFLRWMLSDGAGAFVLEDKPSTKGLSLQINWLDLQSHAQEFPVCMYTGVAGNKDKNEPTWLDYPDFESASKAGAINLKQDIRLLDHVVKKGVAHYFELIDKGLINPKDIDWLCCHYSSEYFKEPIKELMKKGGGEISEEKWFSNLSYKGNTGAASIYIMLEELMYSGKLKPGQKILCMVPESGRFITSFMLLTVSGEPIQKKVYPIREIEAPELVVNQTKINQWLVRQLSQIWIDFESKLLNVPIVKKIHQGSLTKQEYMLLMKDLRMQVMEGSRWIARAASNIDIELFDLRSAFITHTATEHKDYQILEKNYVEMGGDLEEMRQGLPNIGSLALSSFMFHRASQTNPIDLLGAMFIIEGIGKRLAGFWGEMIKDQLNLNKDQVSFFTYHGVADENHFHRLEKALNDPRLNMDIAKKIAQTAKVTAHLYHMQLSELGNY